MKCAYREPGIYEKPVKINLINEYYDEFLKSIEEENENFVNKFEEKDYETNQLEESFFSMYDPREIIGKNINGKRYYCLLLSDIKIQDTELIKKQEESLSKIILIYEKYLNSLENIISQEKEITALLKEEIENINKRNVRATSLINNLIKNFFEDNYLKETSILFKVEKEEMIKKFNNKLTRLSYLADERILNSVLLMYYISIEEWGKRSSILFLQNKDYINLSFFNIFVMNILDPQKLKLGFDEIKNWEIIKNNKNAINYIIFNSLNGVIGEYYFDWEYNELEDKYIRKGNVGNFINYGMANLVGLNRLFKTDKFLSFLKEYYNISGELLVDFKEFEYNDKKYKINENSFLEIKWHNETMEKK